MIIVLSPAKTLDFESRPSAHRHSSPVFPERVKELVDVLATKTPQDLSQLMSISQPLAELNYQRYQMWDPNPSKASARPAITAFRGDVYRGLDVQRLDARDLNHAQKHLRILSGLYGVLRPLDLMQPYRLEMGSRLANPAGPDLYTFWRDTVTAHLNTELSTTRPRVLVNLASQEYFGVVNESDIDARVVTPVFKDRKNGNYKVISFFAKQARGSMTAWLIQNRIASVRKMRDFAEDGYRYSPEDSSADSPVYLRG